MVQDPMEYDSPLDCEHLEYSVIHNYLWSHSNLGSNPGQVI